MGPDFTGRGRKAQEKWVLPSRRITLADRGQSGQRLNTRPAPFRSKAPILDGGLSPRVAPFADLRDLGAPLQRAGFALPVTDVDRVVVRYGDVFGLMHDLRRMGATNVLTERRRTPLMEEFRDVPI